MPDALFGSRSPSLVNFVLNQTTDAIEWIFNVSGAITITKLGFRYGLRTGTPPTFKISLQGVGVTGNPDGTIKGGGSPASATFTPPADTTWDGTWQWITLANPYTTTRGEFLAIVIAQSSGTINASNNSSFTTNNNNTPTQNFPYAIRNDAGTRTRQNTMPVYGYSSSSLAYGNVIQGVWTTAINASTTPDEQALNFMFPGDSGQTYQVIGVRLTMTLPAGQSVKLILYDGTTVLQDVTFDTDLQYLATDISPFEIFFDEATLSDLLFGSVYRLSLQPQAASGTYYISALTVASTNDLTAWAGSTNFYQSTRTDGGAWSDDTLTRPFVELIIDDWQGGAVFNLHE